MSIAEKFEKLRQFQRENGIRLFTEDELDAIQCDNCASISAKLAAAREALQRIVNIDYRGYEPTEHAIAREGLERSK